METAHRIWAQSSEMVEWTNQALKETLQVDQRDWLLLGGLASDGSARTQDDPHSPKAILHTKLCMGGPLP